MPAMPTTVLVVHRGLITQRDEVADLCQMIAGAIESGCRDHVEIEMSDGQTRYRPTLQAGELELVPLGRLAQAVLRGRYDIALIHEPVPLVHLALAAVLRLQGTAVVHQPITMLGQSYSRGTWFARRTRAFRLAKPFLVRMMRRAWLRAAHGFICVSDFEVVESQLPPERCRVLRWPSPPTGLAAATEHLDRPGPTCLGPVAFVNRFDWHRKGFDRLCAWLELYGDELPQPAVLLCAPVPEAIPQRLSALVDQGLIEWNPTASGTELLSEIQRCRAVMLLSRWDGQSRILREAALAGVPTISTVNSHFSEIVVELGRGIVVDGDDPHSVQQAFRAIGAIVIGPDSAGKLFDRAAVGQELIDHLLDLAHQAPRVP